MTFTLKFEELTTAFKKRIGYEFYYGSLSKEFVSLYWGRALWSPIPVMQMSMDISESEHGSQIIRFKMANFAAFGYALIIAGVNIVVNWVIPLGLTTGLFWSLVIYLVLLAGFQQQFDQFKSLLNSVEREAAKNAS